MPSPPKTSLVSDQRGAMMLIGIAMALFLTGITWYMVGVGRMLIAHDHFQEAADSAAFTSAVIHARGMNLIAALNLVMLALTSVYLLLAILFAALLAATIAAAGSVVLAVPIANATYGTYNAWTKYYAFYKGAIKGINYVQTGAAVVFPWAAEAASLDIGSRYGKSSVDGAEPTTFSASVSMVPGPNALRAALQGPKASAPAGGSVNADQELADNLPTGGTDPPSKPDGPGDLSVPEGGDGNTCNGPEGKFTEKIGLPVRGERPGAMCDDLVAKLAEYVIDQAAELANVHLPNGGRFDTDFGLNVRDDIADALGGGSELAFCGGIGRNVIADLVGKIDGLVEPVKVVIASIVGNVFPNLDVPFWQETSGPKVMFDGGTNGSTWMQVYGFAVGVETDVRSGKLVSMAKGANVRRDAGGLEGSPSFPMGYFAQAEFYFDCSEEFSACNAHHDATYAMRWRARLRQVVVPAILETTFAAIGGAIAQADSKLGWLRDRIPSGKDNVLSGLQEFVANFLASDLAAFLKIDRTYVERRIPDLGLIRVPDLSGFAGPTPVIH